MASRSALLLTAACCAAGAASAAPREWARPAAAHPARVAVGTGNVAVIAPPVRHPAEAPCIVPLYRNAVFGGNQVNYSYTPPANCPGPYATIVLSVNIALDAGIQYDRTGTIWLGGVPLWFGTTAEPAPDNSPSWHVERDVTDYAATLARPQSGFVLIANYTNATDTSLVTSSASLLFYPATTAYPAPRVPDVIVPLASPGGGTIGLGSGTSTATITQTLPTNIQAASLDVYLQGQSADEFWYTCVPNALAGTLQSCGNGAFREGEITIDGTPAGTAPVTPWIFTGGIDPDLWSPIPGVQTLDFKPFRVQLSPFAGLLSNGAPHTIGLSVFNADNYFSVAGALFLYLDPASTQITGGITKNTLAAAPTVVTQSGTGGTGDVTTASVTTGVNRAYTISGTVTGSAGTTTYTVQQNSAFTNDQQFRITGNSYVQNIQQNTSTITSSTAAGPSGTVVTTATHTTPLNVAINEAIGANGLGKQSTKITQNFTDTASLINGTALVSKSYTNDQITTQDTLFINFVQGVLTGNTGQSSTASYFSTATGQPCYGVKLTSQSGVVTSATPLCQ